MPCNCCREVRMYICMRLSKMLSNRPGKLGDASVGTYGTNEHSLPKERRAAKI